MKIYLYQDGDQLIELVEKAEYDLLRFAPNYLQSELRAANAILTDTQAELNAVKQELQNVVTRMEDVSIHKLEDLFLEHATDWIQGLENVRARLIKAAKGEQP